MTESVSLEWIIGIRVSLSFLEMILRYIYAGFFSFHFILKCSETQTETNRQILHHLVHSPNTNACNSQSSVRLKPRAWNLIQVCHVGGKGT